MIKPEDVLKYIDEMKTIEAKDVEKLKKDVNSDNIAWVDNKPAQAPLDIKQQANTDTIISNNNIPTKITKELLDEYLRDYYMEHVKQRNSYQKENLSVTDLVNCIRMVYFDFVNTERKRNYIYPYEEIVTEVGNTIHSIIQKRIPCIDKEEKIKITDVFAFPISFRMDIHLNDKTLIEIKTIDALPDKPKPEHMKQAIMYAYFLNRFKNYNIDLVQLLYVSRGKIDIKVFDIPITTQLLDKVDISIKEYINDLKRHIDMNVPPPLTNKYIDKNKCFFCDYSYICQTTSNIKYKTYSEKIN